MEAGSKSHAEKRRQPEHSGRAGLGWFWRVQRSKTFLWKPRVAAFDRQCRCAPIYRQRRRPAFNGQCKHAAVRRLNIRGPALHIAILKPGQFV